ncbi:hypothetical protein [Kitasatospora sp. NPDC002040]|uniref:hypothetical protein n=1 Tax=Kitasatospora sp. NPDC002040 TaxID=3154661 RepID=UPI00331EC2E1
MRETTEEYGRSARLEDEGVEQFSAFSTRLLAAIGAELEQNLRSLGPRYRSDQNELPV